MARISGASLDSIAASFDVRRDAVWRHTSKHVSDNQRAMYLADVDLKSLAERANRESLSLIDYVSITRGVLMQQMQMAAGVNDRNGTAALAGRLNETLKLGATLTGELLRINPTVINHNTAIFLSSPLYRDLEKLLVRTLSEYPEALAKVVEGLRQLEQQEPPEDAVPAFLAAPPMRDEGRHA